MPPQEPALPEVDERLRSALRGLARDKPDFWSCLYGRSQVEQPYFEYPARMVAPMQRDILRTVRRLQPGIATCFEPFAGSGTILLECLAQGLRAIGQDINPLAILLCRARTSIAPADRLRLAADEVIARSAADHRRSIDVDFPGIGKWFRPVASRDLSRLRRAIQLIPDIQARRFLWVCLAETVRRTSNSRTSTYKLHIRPPSEISSLPLPREVFSLVCNTNIARHKKVLERMRQADVAKSRTSGPAVSIRLRDSMLPIPDTCDLVMTSPPYGDNTSTVPYGQQAYLPLQWICHSDIDSRAPRDNFLASTHEIDRRSLGGERFRGDFSQRFGDLLGRSRALEDVVCSLSRHPPNSTNRVLSFVADLDAAASAIAASLRTNGYAIWTVGNRCVGGMEIPLDKIMVELLATHRLRYVTRVSRRIPQKRMPTRNNISDTMNREKAIVFRKS